MKKVTFFTVLTAIAGALGAVVDSGLVPPPYQGLAVALAVMLGGMARPPKSKVFGGEAPKDEERPSKPVTGPFDPY